MSPLFKKLLAVFLIVCSGIIIVTFFTSETGVSIATNSATHPVTEHQSVNKTLPESNFANFTPNKNTPTQQNKNKAEGINTIFRDKAKTQIAWMQRGKKTVIKNNPDADAADFRNTFFHRGAKARPVTCGEVQFRRKDEIVDDYQRFIYTGVQSTYLERDVVNFDTFWSIMCEQTLDEYFEQ